MIKYVGRYRLNNEKPLRIGFPSAITKMDYISDSLYKATSQDVNIISSSWYAEEGSPSLKTTQKKIRDGIYLTYPPSWTTKNRYTLRIKAIFTYIWLFLYLILNCRKDEDVIVYHSLPMTGAVLRAKKIKKFSLVLELNEIYTNAVIHSKSIRKKEFKIIRAADKYIFSTELLNEKVNFDNKPYIINYGTYKCEENIAPKFDDGKIHIVYAGTFEARKSGAVTAATVGKFLDEKYHIHIIGFGSDDEKRNLIEHIKKVSQESRCTITYDGLISGNDYIRFLQSCHIGMSTQNPDDTFNDTSFPSKILSYLSNGLRVISTRIPAIEKSDFADILYFYDTNDPQKIADTIRKINFDDEYDSRKEINFLDKKFLKNMKIMLG